MTKTLDLGCGENPKNPFGADLLFGVDVVSNLSLTNIKIADLAVEPIPYESNTFDFVTAFDFIEHVPRVVHNPKSRFAFVELMNEIYRVLKPDGRFLSFTPCYPSEAVFGDPTHVNFITTETFPYFCGEKPATRKYGFNGQFLCLLNRWHDWKTWPVIANTEETPMKTHMLSLLQKTEFGNTDLIR